MDDRIPLGGHMLDEHLSELSFIFHSLPHLHKASKSLWRVVASEEEIISLYRKPSSAKSIGFDEKYEGMSFTLSRNKRGQRTVPCGTPDVTSAVSENHPLDDSFKNYWQSKQYNMEKSGNMKVDQMCLFFVGWKYLMTYFRMPS